MICLRRLNLDKACRSLVKLSYNSFHDDYFQGYSKPDLNKIDHDKRKQLVEQQNNTFSKYGNTTPHGYMMEEQNPKIHKFEDPVYGNRVAEFEFLPNRYSDKAFQPSWMAILAAARFFEYGKNCLKIYRYEKNKHYTNFEIAKRVKKPFELKLSDVQLSTLKDRHKIGVNFFINCLNKNPYYTEKEKIYMLEQLLNILNAKMDERAKLFKNRFISHLRVKEYKRELRRKKLDVKKMILSKDGGGSSRLEDFVMEPLPNLYEIANYYKDNNESSLSSSETELIERFKRPQSYKDRPRSSKFITKPTIVTAKGQEETLDPKLTEQLRQRTGMIGSSDDDYKGTKSTYSSDSIQSDSGLASTYGSESISGSDGDDTLDNGVSLQSQEKRKSQHSGTRQSSNAVINSKVHDGDRPREHDTYQSNRDGTGETIDEETYIESYDDADTLIAEDR